MDEGLREAISRADPDASRPLAIERLVDLVRQMHAIARKGDPDTAGESMTLARDAAWKAVQHLPLGGELRRRLESGELISEEDWERLAGTPPPLPTPPVKPLS